MPVEPYRRNRRNVGHNRNWPSQGQKVIENVSALMVVIELALFRTREQTL
jgi:hypothetical protein